jgi:hypothetical protein
MAVGGEVGWLRGRGWQPGQAWPLVALIRVLVGAVMAATMAAVTGAAIVRLLRR